MPNQNFWESLHNKYREKNKALLNKEADLRYKIEAMEAIINKNNFYKRQLQLKCVEASKEKPKPPKQIKKTSLSLIMEKPREKPTIHKIPSEHPEPLKHSAETGTSTSELAPQQKEGFFHSILTFLSFLTRRKKTSQTDTSQSMSSDLEESEIKSNDSKTDNASQSSDEIPVAVPQMKKSMINFILPEQSLSLHSLGSIDFENTSLGKIFFDKCNFIGHKICQIDAMANLSETYESVKLRSIRVALQLRKMGIRPTDIISTSSCNTMDSAIPSIATLFLGAKVFNLDPRVSVKNIKHLLSIAPPAVMFIEESSVPKFQECLQETNFKGHLVVFGESDQYLKFSDLLNPDPEEDIFKPAKTHITDLAILVYSSGTTGLSKVVCHSNYSFLQLLKMLFTCNITADRLLHTTTLSWLSALITLTMTWMTGGIRVFSNGVSGEHTLRIIEKYKVALLYVPVFDTYNLTNIENPERFDLSSLKKVVTGGSPINGKQIEKLGNIFKSAVILNCYGLSETGIITTFDPEIHDKRFIETKDGSCGELCLGASIKVVDPETNEVLGPHQKGEIRIKSVGMMVDYYKHDSSDYFDSDNYFQTGDVGYYDEDGYFYIVARCKEIFKYRGWPITPSLIEQNLLEHPAVDDAAVFGVPYGDDGEAPAACIVLKKNVQVDEKDIENFLKGRVADEEQLRGGVIFVDEIPRNPTGNVDLKELEKFKNTLSVYQSPCI